MRKVNLALGLFVVFMFGFIANVSAKEINVTDVSTLTQALADADAGDTIILADGSYNTDITIEKDIVLKGTSVDGTIVNGSVILNAEGIEVTLDSLTITDAGTIIDVKATSTLTVNNAKVLYAGYNGTFSVNNSDGIWLEKTANGSTVNVTNSTVVAKYAIWVYGEENTVNVTGSTINGWAAIDISNGSGSQTTANNNKVSINDSTIIGTNVYNGRTDAYGVIVIGGQSNVKVEISGSTVKNEFPVTNNQVDVILFSTSYATSEKSEVTISNSELINNDATGSSAVINYSSEEIQDGENIVSLYETKITSENDTIYNTAGNYVTFTIDLMGVQTTTTIPANSTIPEDALVLDEIEGYTFEGWYLDEDFTTPFDATVPVTDNTILYAKLTEIVEEPTTPENPSEPEEPIENPSTSDNILTYVVLGGISLVGIVGASLYLKKKSN